MMLHDENTSIVFNFKNGQLVSSYLYNLAVGVIVPKLRSVRAFIRGFFKEIDCGKELFKIRIYSHVRGIFRTLLNI